MIIIHNTYMAIIEGANVVQQLAASRSRPQPQIGCGCGQDFGQRAAAGGYAPSIAGYGHIRYIKTTPCFTKWLNKLMVKIGSRIYMSMVTEEEPRSEHANSELVSANEQ